MPVSVEPVNEIKRTSGWSMIASPTSSPPPMTRLTTPAGTPASARISTKSNGRARRVMLAGLKTTVLPATIAGKIFQDGIAIGKFQGVMMPHTPSGLRTDMCHLFGNSDGVVWPVQAATFAGHVVGHVDGFLDIAAGFGR